MTELLKEAIPTVSCANAQIQQLPPDQQDAILLWSRCAIASRLLDELKNDQAWTTRFAATTDDQWDKLAKMVRGEITEGKTFPLDDVFPG